MITIDLPIMTTAQRDNLNAFEGDVIFNGTLNEGQIYANGGWVNF